MLIVEKFQVGALKTNCYFLKDSNTGNSAIIDPGGISTKLDKVISSLDKDKFKYIFLTHGHFDHIRKGARYKELTGAKVILGEQEKDFVFDQTLNLSNSFSSRNIDFFSVDKYVKDNDKIMLGEVEVTVIATPGHTVGGVCYLAGNYLFTGDTLMKRTIGRVDFKTGNIKDMKESLKKLKNLNNDYLICPGHGDTSTLFYEKENNDYLVKY